MRSIDVIKHYQDIQHLGATVWIDGGWGVEALLGKQTRNHRDLDIVIEQKHLEATVTHCQQQGFSDVPQADSRAWNFVLGNDDGLLIDFHVIVLDAAGNGQYGPSTRCDGEYPAQALTGHGIIDGVPVRCTSPEFQVSSHTGYPLTEKDVQDVLHLCEKYDLNVPAEYQKLILTR